MGTGGYVRVRTGSAKVDVWSGEGRGAAVITLQEAKTNRRAERRKNTLLQATAEITKSSTTRGLNLRLNNCRQRRKESQGHQREGEEEGEKVKRRKRI